MKKPVILLTVAAGLTLASCADRHTEPITGKVVNTENPRVAHGQLLYNQYCQKCHPGNGEAGLGPELLHKPGFARRIQTRHGFGVMPAFKTDVLSKQDVKDIQVYLKAVRKLR